MVQVAGRHRRRAEAFEGPDTRELGSWVVAVAAFLLLAFRQAYVVPFVPLALSPALVILYASGFLYLLTRLAGQRSGFRLGRLGPVLTLFFLSTLLAYGAGMMRPSTPISAADQNLVREAAFLLVVLFIFTVVRTYSGLERILKGLILGACVAAALAIVKHLTGVEVAESMRLPGLNSLDNVVTLELIRGDLVRPQSTAGHPLELAVVLTMVFPLALGLTYSLRAAGRRWWPWAVASALLLMAETLTLSRSALVGLLVVFAVMAVTWPLRRTLTVLALAVCGSLLVLLLDPAILNAYSTIFGAGLQEGSAAERGNAATNLLSHFDLFGDYGVTYDPGTASTLDNAYLSRLATSGVFGLATYTALIVATLAVLVIAYRNAKKQLSPDLPAYAPHLILGMTASFASFSALTFFIDVDGFTQIRTMMWLLIALGAAVLRLSRNSTPAQSIPTRPGGPQ